MSSEQWTDMTACEQKDKYKTAELKATGKNTSFSPYKHQTYANQLAVRLNLELVLDSNSCVKMSSFVSKAACSVTDQSDKRTAANLKANTQNGFGQADLKVILN